MASRFNPFSAARRVFKAARRLLPGGKQPPPEKITPPSDVTPPRRVEIEPSPVRPSPRPRSDEGRSIMRTIAALHDTGVLPREDSDIEALQDDVGLAGAGEILREQLESTQAYLALARQLGHAPRIGESQPGNDRWHERDSKYAGLRRAHGAGQTLHIPNWYDKFFFYHGTNY